MPRNLTSDASESVHNSHFMRSPEQWLHLKSGCQTCTEDKLQRLPALAEDAPSCRTKHERRGNAISFGRKSIASSYPSVGSENPWIHCVDAFVRASIMAIRVVKMQSACTRSFDTAPQTSPDHRRRRSGCSRVIAQCGPPLRSELQPNPRRFPLPEFSPVNSCQPERCHAAA